MKFVIVAGALVLAAGAASAAYLVELDGGERMTVDSYWVEGDRIHLMRGGVDLNVLKSRVRAMHEVAGAPDDEASDPKHKSTTAPPTESTTEAAPATGAAKPTREELEAEQATIEKHLLRVQQERFEAANRGDDEDEQARLKKDFESTQNRRRDVIRQLQQ